MISQAKDKVINLVYIRKMSVETAVEKFKNAPRHEAEDLFSDLSPEDQWEILSLLPHIERRSWIRYLQPDDIADLIQVAPEAEREGLLALLGNISRKEVQALLAYAEDDAGGLMNSRFARMRPEMTIDEAIRYLRKQSPHVETIHYAYVLDSKQRLLGVVSFRELFSSDPKRIINDIMIKDVVKVPEDMSQGDVSQILNNEGLIAVPVVDSEGVMKGIITFDDIADVVSEETTEDIHKMGAIEALDVPYLKTNFSTMLQKRVGWLALLFIGEMFTASAMAFYENQIAKAIVLTMFIPLIISSGGNSGSQASTLVIRAMALGEVRLQDWWQILRREIAVGLTIGGILGVMGFFRVILWHSIWGMYGQHYIQVAGTVGLSLVGVICWGAISGSMLPFILRRVGFDPASASTPFVATLVDVTGLVIYFSIASSFLAGRLI
jgi:magnesium transporter